MKTIIYDGSTPLQPALIELRKGLPVSQGTIANIIKQAKAELGISCEYGGKGKTKSVTEPVQRLAIWQWQKDKLNQAENSLQTELLTVTAEPEPAPVVIFKPVEIISQPEPLENYPRDALVRIAFYTVNQGVKKREVIALDGFYVNALLLATGINKKDVPVWVQSAVDNFAGFDSAKPITRQVKYLLIQELTKRHALSD